MSLIARIAQSKLSPLRVRDDTRALARLITTTFITQFWDDYIDYLSSAKKPLNAH
jgi:hypothetical protein